MPMTEELNFDTPDYFLIEEYQEEQEKESACTDARNMHVIFNPFTVLSGGDKE
jgi:hypothetical protein